MFDDKVILCGSSSYEKIFYFNPEFDSLPKQIKDELQIESFYVVPVPTNRNIILIRILTPCHSR